MSTAHDSSQLELVEASAAVVPLQEGVRPPANVGPFFVGARRRGTAKKLRDQLYAVGAPYHLAPAPAVEVTAILFELSNQFAARQAGVPVTPYDIRSLRLRTAALMDRLAIESEQPGDQVCALNASWVLQHWDRDHREHVRGEWQPDAIKWAALGPEPSSGDPGYARQEYAVWRKGQPAVRRG